MHAPDLATIQALRSDLALQIARCLKRRGKPQVSAALELDIPQPTLSKIMNGRVSELSLELLIRIAVRAGLPVVLQTGTVPEEAGVFVSGAAAAPQGGSTSRLANETRARNLESARRLRPGERLEAQRRHSELVAALHRGGEPRRRSR